MSGELVRSVADTVCVRGDGDGEVACLAVRPGTTLSVTMPRDVSDPWLVGDSLRAGHHREELVKWAVTGWRGDTLLVAGDPRDPLQVAQDSERAPGVIQRQVYRTRPVGRVVVGGLGVAGGLALARYSGNREPDAGLSTGSGDILLAAAVTGLVAGGVATIISASFPSAGWDDVELAAFPSVRHDSGDGEAGHALSLVLTMPAPWPR